METGQMNMIQITTDATSLATVTGNTKTQSVQDGAEDSSAFAGILRGMTPKAPAQSTVVAGVTMAEIVSQTETAVEVVPLVVVEMKPEILATVITAPAVQLSDKATLKAVPAEHSEKDVEQKQPEDLIPGAAVTNAALAQAAQMLQMAGSMPESAQKVDLQVDAVDTPLKSIQLPNLKADSTKVPEQAVTTSVIAETKPTAVSVPAIMEQAIQAATRMPELATETAQGGSVTTPEVQPIQNAPGAALAPKAVTTPEIQAAKAASPELSSIRLQQIMGAYSLPFKAASATPASATPAVTKTDSATPVVAIQALAAPVAATVASATPVIAVPVAAVPVAATPVAATPVAAEPESATPAAATPAAATTSAGAASAATTPAAVTPAAVTPVVVTSAAATPVVAASVAATAVVAASAATTSALATAAVATQAGERPVEALVVLQPAQESSQVATPVEIQPGQHLEAASKARTDAAASITAASSALQPGTPKPGPLPVVAAVPEQLQAVTAESPLQRAIETGAVTVVVKVNDRSAGVQEELIQQQTPVTKDVKAAVNAGTVIPGAVKGVATATTGEDSKSGDKSMSDRPMNGQLHQVFQQQQTKTETVASAPVTVSTAGVVEQVVKQVGEHLAKNEIKSGSEQIVLRLSPENLGELKVNLRMENQRLTVEIVTENRAVRDTLLQNLDTLKDSLAKQNIKMDSFDVSTGGNNAGFGGRGQNDWRELAQSRQSFQWQQSGGYNVPKDFIPEKLAYNPQAEYGVLDVHY